MASVGDLPDEVLLCIFRNLPVKELTSLQLVNHRWKRVVSDRSLYPVVTVDANDSISAVIALLKQQQHSIRRLYIIERYDTRTLAPFIAECSNLETLSFCSCYGENDGLLNIIERCRHLTTLVLEHSPYVHKLGKLFKALSTSSVKKIVIRNLEDDLEIEHLSGLWNVEDLRLNCVGVHLDGVYRFCTNNAHCLTTLKLNLSKVMYLVSNDDVNETLYKAIGNCKCLKKLCLGPKIASEMNDIGFSYITKLDSLSTFELSNAVSISTPAFIEFFARPSAKRLRKLNLFKCPAANNSVLRCIASWCCNLEKFTLEKLKGTRSVGDVEVWLMFAKSCPKLRWLNMYGAHISTAEVLPLLPPYLPMLRTVTFSTNDDPLALPSFLAVLEKRMPQFEVCGLQWKFQFYVKCTKKGRNSSPPSNLVCSLGLKTHARCS